MVRTDMRQVVFALVFFITWFQPSPLLSRETIMVTDALERRVVLNHPPERVVVVNTAVAIILRAIGVDLENRIVGVTHYVKENSKFWPKLKDKPGIRFTNPSYETLARLKPDAVFFYENSPRYTSEEILDALNIPSVYLNGFDPRTLDREISLLGKIFNREKQAAALNTWCQEAEGRITRRVSGIHPQNRLKVFYYIYPDSNLSRGIYRTCNRMRSSHGIIEKAGGINIAADLPDGFNTVSAEWIMEQDPDVIIAGVIGKDFSGYNADPQEARKNLKSIRERLILDRAFRNTRAGKNRRVLVMAQDLKQGPAYVVGLAHSAKYLYPDRFGDIDPEEFAQQYYEQWCGLPFKGIFIDPPYKKEDSQNRLIRSRP